MKWALPKSNKKFRVKEKATFVGRRQALSVTTGPVGVNFIGVSPFHGLLK
jgi:hypothetical protein